MEMDIALAWQNLEAAIDGMKDPGDEFELRLNTVLAGVTLLFEFSPEEIVAQVEASELPTRPTISWLVYEGARLKGVVDPSRVRALARHWQRLHPDQPLIPGPDQKKSQRLASGNGHGRPAPA